MADGNAHSSAGVFTEPLVGPLVGSIVAHDDRGLVVDFPGNLGRPVPARTVIPLDDATIADAIAQARGVLLTFEHGRAELPIVLGLLHEPGGASAVAHVDGRRIEITGKDEIVLRCGDASITLRRNGRVVIRGSYVETRASGVNRIRGGSVAIN